MDMFAWSIKQAVPLRAPVLPQWQNVTLRLTLWT